MFKFGRLPSLDFTRKSKKLSFLFVPSDVMELLTNGNANRIIAKGASGGLGPGNTGGSGSPGLAGYGARVRAVFFFSAGTQIYFLVGQEGVAAIRDKPKDHYNRNSSESVGGGGGGGSSGSSNGEIRRALERVRGLHNASNGVHGSGNGGGGGGATFVFQVRLFSFKLFDRFNYRC